MALVLGKVGACILARHPLTFEMIYLWRPTTHSVCIRIIHVVMFVVVFQLMSLLTPPDSPKTRKKRCSGIGRRNIAVFPSTFGRSACRVGRVVCVQLSFIENGLDDFRGCPGKAMFISCMRILVFFGGCFAHTK